MTPEQEIAKALADEADRHDVDVQALYVATRERLTSATTEQRAHRRPSRRGLGAAAAVAAVVAAVSLVPALVDRSVEREDGVTAAHAVDASFSCPVRSTTRFTARNDDDSFLPGLTLDGLPAGDAAGAARYEVVRRGAVAELRLGNADGTLASVATFRLSDEAYERVSVTKCSNAAPAAPAAPQPLLTPGLVPGPSDFAADDFPPGAAKVVDRLTYATSGLEKRQSIWAYPCGTRLCLVSGSRTSTQITSRLPGDGTPSDLTSQLSDPDDVVGIDPAQRLLAVYDTTDAPSAVSWTDRNGGTTPVSAVDGGGWAGRLFLALVPSRSFETLDVATGTARPESYSLADITG